MKPLSVLVTPGAVFYLKQVVKDIIQTDDEIVIKVALEIGHYRYSLIVRHVCKHIAWIKRVGIIQLEISVFQQININRSGLRANDPVFSDTALLIGTFFAALVIQACTGGKNFYYQVWRTMDPVWFDLIPIANHHKIRDIMIRLREKNLFPVATGDAFFSF